MQDPSRLSPVLRGTAYQSRLLSQCQVQLRHALNVYVDGTPYDFRYKLRPVGLDQDDFATDSVWGDISECLFEVAESYDPMLKIAIRQALGPMLKCIAAHDNQHPHEACGNCGKKNADDGSPCRPCSHCGQRLYCSRKCELAHRPQHKLICDDPTYRRMGNPWVALQKTRKEKQAALLTDLNDLTVDSDGQNDMPSAKPASPASPSSTVGGDLTTCGHCGAKAASGKLPTSCRKCDRQHYCNKKCQKAHWPAYKKICLIDVHMERLSKDAAST
ncbi:hypothetical protein KCU91_g15533, partial [Aureobasidium melanogenum]